MHNVKVCWLICTSPFKTVSACTNVATWFGCDCYHVLAGCVRRECCWSAQHRDWIVAPAHGKPSCPGVGLFFCVEVYMWWHTLCHDMPQNHIRYHTAFPACVNGVLSAHCLGFYVTVVDVGQWGTARVAKIVGSCKHNKVLPLFCGEKYRWKMACIVLKCNASVKHA